MSKKRRTRKQKVQARHSFEISWQPKFEKPDHTPVKRQTSEPIYAQKSDNRLSKKAVNAGFLLDVGTVKRDLVKSVIMSVIILGIETVLYLLWKTA